MRYLFKFLLFLFSLNTYGSTEGAAGCISCKVEKSSKPPVEVTAVASMFKAPMLDCPSRIWPNYDWKNLQVVFTYPSSDTSWLWSGSDASVNPISTLQLPTSALESGFEFFELNNKASVSIDMENEDEPFVTTIHEFFHDQGQNEEDVGGLRGTEYPINPEPRVFRSMLKTRLYEALQAKTDQLRLERLRQAAFWFQKWKTKYPEEFKSSTDGYEGTATYVELMAAAVASKGCKATDEILLSYASDSLINKEQETSLNSLMLDSEGYEIGGAASLLLKGSSNSSWFAQTSNGIPATEILLGSLSPTENNAPKSLVDSLSIQAEGRNKILAKEIGTDIQLFNNAEYVRVGISINSLQTNFQPKGFYKNVEVPNGIVFALGFEHRFKNASAQMIAAPGNVFMLLQGYESSCQSDTENPTLYTLIRKSDLKLEGPKLSINKPGLKASLVGNIQQDRDGFSYFCTK